MAISTILEFNVSANSAYILLAAELQFYWITGVCLTYFSILKSDQCEFERSLFVKRPIVITVIILIDFDIHVCIFKIPLLLYTYLYTVPNYI